MNRTTGQRTAPSAVNWKEIDIYAAMKTGLYLYNAAGNTLEQIHGKDIRPLTGNQPFNKNTPANRVYAADYERISGGGRAISEPVQVYRNRPDIFYTKHVYSSRYLIDSAADGFSGSISRMFL